jgi:subfamily B ATP-binding cassette protein MsbA
MNKIRFIIGYSANWKWKLITALLGLIFVSAVSLLFPWMMKIMVDHFQKPEPFDAIFPSIFTALIFTFLLSTVVGYFSQLLLHEVGFHVRNELRSDFFNSLLYRPLLFHRGQQVGELSARASEDIGKLQTLFASVMAPMIQNILFIVGCAILMSVLHWWATILFFGLIALTMPLIVLLSKKIQYHASRSQAEHASAHAVMEESLISIREVKAFARESVELERYRAYQENAFGHEYQSSKFHAKINQIIYFILSMILVGIFYIGSVQTVVPSLSVGHIIAFYMYAYNATMAFVSMGRAYTSYQSIAGALDRIVELMPKAASRGESMVASGALGGTIEFQNVDFSYEPGEPVLVGFSLKVNNGKWLLIQGPSGSGKSTIASLVLGLFEPQSGRILLEGISIAHRDMAIVRRQIGYVGQEPFLIRGTFRENLLFSRAQVSSARFDNVIDMCCLRDIIDRLPNGLDSVIGERGYTLSGGQKARMAIARAILFDPAILILDEASAMLERELETELWHNVWNDRQNKTTLILSHHSHNIPKVYEALDLVNLSIQKHADVV